MNDAEFITLMDDLKKYLEEEKAFIKNPTRFAEVERATEIAKELFTEATISINDDPLQMGSLVVRIESFDIVVRGEREIKLFYELISKANNFEVYSTDNGNVRLAIMFRGALTRIQ